MNLSPSAINRVIKSSEEIQIATAGDGKSFSMIIRTDWNTRKTDFQLEREFQLVYGKGLNKGYISNFCRRPAQNIIHCKSSEPLKGWLFEFDLVFTPEGLTNARTFKTKNVDMKKYYRRVKTRS